MLGTFCNTLLQEREDRLGGVCFQDQQLLWEKKKNQKKIHQKKFQTGKAI